MIKQHSGEPNIEGYKKTASTLFANGDVVTTSSGLLVRATATTEPDDIVGLIQRDVLATDEDYAETSVVPVLVTDGNANEFLMPVTTGTAVQAMVGGRYDLEDHAGLDVTAQAIGVFKITAVISTTLVKGRFISNDRNTTV
jgi:hypothetical protein